MKGLETLPNMWWYRCCLTHLFLSFLTLRVNYFLQFSSCGPWNIFSHSNYPLHRALGRYRHTSSSRQFRNILCWLEILNYRPDGRNGNFHCSSSFLKATSRGSCEAQLSFSAHQKYILWFSHCDGWLREFGLCFSSYLYFMFIITLECSKLWIWMCISEILRLGISRVPIILSNVYLWKNIIS